MSRTIETLHRGHQAHRNQPHFPTVSVAARVPVQWLASCDVAAPYLTPSGHSESLFNEGAQWSSFQAAESNTALDPAGAAYARLLGRLATASDLSQPRAWCLAAIEPDDATILVALNLALVAASDVGRRVLLIDAHIESPRAAKHLRIDSSPGLSDMLVDGIHPSEIIRRVPGAGYDVLTAGRASRRAAELLTSRRTQALISSLKRSYDIILVDTPYADSMWAQQFRIGFDAWYAVLRVGRTKRAAVERAEEVWRHAGIVISGCILTHDGPSSDTLENCNAPVPDLQQSRPSCNEAVPLIIFADTTGPTVVKEEVDALVVPGDSIQLAELQQGTQTEAGHEPPVAEKIQCEEPLRGNPTLDELSGAFGAIDEECGKSASEASPSPLTPLLSQGNARLDEAFINPFALGRDVQGVGACETNFPLHSEQQEDEKLITHLQLLGEGRRDEPSIEYQTSVAEPEHVEYLECPSVPVEDCKREGQDPVATDQSNGSPDETCEVDGVAPETNVYVRSDASPTAAVEAELSFTEPEFKAEADCTSPLVSDAETLRRLESIRPFDSSEEESMSPSELAVSHPIESRGAAGDELQSEPAAMLSSEESAGPEAPSLCESPVSSTLPDAAFTCPSQRLLTQENTSSPLTASTNSPVSLAPDSRTYRISRLSLRAMRSGQSDDGAAAAGETNDPWAFDVLAVCGGLLLLAGIIFIASDLLSLL